MKNLTIIIIIITLILIYIILFIKQTDKYKNDPLYNYQDIKARLKTGDIILFSSNNNESTYNSLEYYIRTSLIGSQYGHVGIIIKDKNKLLVAECVTNSHCGSQYGTFLNNYGLGGVRLIDFETLINEYYKENAAVFAVKFIDKEIPLSKIIKSLGKYQNKIFENKQKLMTLAVIDVCISHKLASWMVSNNKSNKMMCSEFVHSILNDCDVLKNYPSKLFWPHLITQDDVFVYLQNKVYSRPYKFRPKN